MFVIHVLEIALGCRPSNDLELVIDGISNGEAAVWIGGTIFLFVTAVNELDVGLWTCWHFVTDLS